MIHGRTAALLLTVGLSCVTGRAAETASVTILAVTPFGEVLRPVKVTKFASDRGRGRDYASQFTGAKADGVPIGEYLVQVVAGARRIAGFYRVTRRNMLMVLSGPDKIIEGGP